MTEWHKWNKPMDLILNSNFLEYSIDCPSLSQNPNYYFCLEKQLLNLNYVFIWVLPGVVTCLHKSVLLNVLEYLARWLWSTSTQKTLGTSGRKKKQSKQKYNFIWQIVLLEFSNLYLSLKKSVKVHLMWF